MEVEKKLISVIRSYYPNYCIIGEETGIHFPKSNSSFGKVIIDPIDGTSNFIHRIPYFSISILIHHDNGEKTAIIYDPILREMFTNFPYINSKLIDIDKRKIINRYSITSALISSYISDIETSVLIQKTIWKAGVKRLLTNWSPCLDYCRLVEGLIDIIIYPALATSIEHNAGRVFAASYGVKQYLFEIRDETHSVELCIDYISDIPKDFFKSLK